MLPLEMSGIIRTTSLNILGVTLSASLSVSDHIRGVLSNCSQTLYAIRVLRSHGLCEAGLQTVFQSVIMAKLLYASSAWSGFATAADRQRVNAFLAEASDGVSVARTFEVLLENSDQQLFRKIMNNTQHVLHSLLPPPSLATQHYELRQRTHNRELPDHTGRLTDSNFLTRMLYNK